jgi:hypothetical protein
VSPELLPNNDQRDTQTDGRDLLNMLLRWAQLLGHAYQVSERWVQAFIVEVALACFHIFKIRNVSKKVLVSDAEYHITTISITLIFFSTS